MAKQFVYIGLLSVLLFISCRQDNRYETIISNTESIIEENPDSALAILNRLDSNKSAFDEPLMMRFEMLKASAQNTAYIPFHTDSVAKVFTSYYDKVGNSNQKVMAHYLLGCAYRDIGDSPQTMKCFIDAVELADTTSNDCDYNLLSKVYGQLGMLYIDQELGDEALRALKQAEKYALLGKDTLMAIMCISQQSLVYEMRSDLPQIISNVEYASGLYKKYGYDAEAASALGTAIQALVLSKEYSKAKKYINRYEKESGFFDTDGNIIKRKEQYYYVKGLYYLGIKSDSAEYMFRKELRTADGLYEKMSAVYGLHEYYKENVNKDSLLKYSEILVELKDSVSNAKSTESIRKMASLYKYSHIQKSAEKERENAEWYRLVLVVSVVLFLLGIIICVLLVMYLRIKDINRKKDMEALKGKYGTMLDLLNKEKAELERLKDDKILKSKIIEDKEKYILELNKMISDLKSELPFYQGDTERSDEWNLEELLLDEIVVKDLHSLAVKGNPVSNKEWNDFEEVLNRYLPQFMAVLRNKDNNLTYRETRVCMLIKLRFIPSEIRVLLNLSSQQTTNTRSSINKKLFGKESAKSLDSNISRL